MEIEIKKKIEKYEKDFLKVFGATLLSVEEAEKLLTARERRYNKQWWLQSIGFSPNRAAYIYNGGNTSDLGYIISYSDICVRPALKIESNLPIGTVFIFKGYEFKIISKNLAWLYNDDIGLTYFDLEANIYQYSHIKKFIDNWFENLVKES